MTTSGRKRHSSVTDSSEADGYYYAYEEYSKVLRTWLVAYGIGAPVLLFTNDHVTAMVRQSHWSIAIAAFFLLGVGLQVLLAVVNKKVMWMLYWSERWPSDAGAPLWARAAAWISYQYWMDILVDLGSLVLFGAATFFAFRAILG